MIAEPVGTGDPPEAFQAKKSKSTLVVPDTQPKAKGPAHPAAVMRSAELSVVSMIALDIFFPQVFQGGLLFDALEFGTLVIYLWFALKAAQERPI